MVLLQFPHSLTEEEQMLQTKYAKLRKKKKQVSASKNPSKPDQDKVAKSINSVPEAKDAKEVAKKLIRSGQIHAIQKSVEKERLEKSKGFKRSQGMRDTVIDSKFQFNIFNALFLLINKPNPCDLGLVSFSF